MNSLYLKEKNKLPYKLIFQTFYVVAKTVEWLFLMFCDKGKIVQNIKVGTENKLEFYSNNQIFLLHFYEVLANQP